MGPGLNVVRPDGYYGATASNYDASRSRKLKWHAEIVAVRSFLEEGPVLDAPLGTGRFIPIYREKGLAFTGVDISPDMLALARGKFDRIDARQGSIFDLDFADNAFATAVCIRFLEWLPLDQAKVVLDRLRSIARTLIITITHGTEGQPEAYTYDFNKFLGIIGGLLIEQRQVTARVRDMTSEAFKLRPALWADLVAQFAHDYPQDAEAQIQRIADKHAAFFDLPPIPIRSDTVTLCAEYWNHVAIGVAVHALREFRFITSAQPRNTEAPLTIILRDGAALIIDGRKRANIWMKQPGRHPVLIVRPIAA